MGYRRYKRRNDDGFEAFTWVFFSVVLLGVFVWVFMMGFVRHCVFEYPVRWDIGVCWNEQVDPAKDSAIEQASDFLPRMRK